MGATSVPRPLQARRPPPDVSESRWLLCFFLQTKMAPGRALGSGECLPLTRRLPSWVSLPYWESDSGSSLCCYRDRQLRYTSRKRRRLPPQDRPLCCTREAPRGALATQLPLRRKEVAHPSRPSLPRHPWRVQTLGYCRAPRGQRIATAARGRATPCATGTRNVSRFQRTDRARSTLRAE